MNESVEVSAETNDFGQPVGPPVESAVREFPEASYLRGDYCEVRPLTSAHYADLYASTAGVGDADLWTYRTGVDGMPGSLPELWMHLAGLVDNPGVVCFAIVPLEGPTAGRAAGVATYARVEPTHGSLEIAGILFGRTLQRTRAATEALHLMTRHAFDDLGYRRVEWKCDRLNGPSRRAATRLGFGFEGTFRNHMVVQGRSRDTDWFSIIDEEWPGIRAAHRRWLDPGNFDAAGHQRTPLAE